MTPADRARVAWHESGHALLGLLLPEADPVQKVTIVPRGQALGVTWQAPPDDRHNYAEADLRARIAGALGGRAAEALALGAPSTGAENDLQQATALARQMVTRWGMSPRVGPVYAAREDGGFLAQAGDMPDLGAGVSSRLAATIDQETKRITDECYAVAEETLRRERGRLEALATALLERESLDEEEIRAVTGLPAPPRPAAVDLDGAPSGQASGTPPGTPPGTPSGAPEGTPPDETPAPEGAALDGAARDGSPAAPAAPAPAPLPSA
jgi:cell division protease FtsH